MRKSLLIATAAALAVPAVAFAGVDVNINVGVPAPPPAVVVAAPPPVLFQSPPVFVTPPSLGFYVGVGVPYDIMFVSNAYYLYYGNAWYRSPYYNGPWRAVRYDRLPPVIRTHRLDVIRVSRDAEYRVYREHGEHYRGRHFKPGKAEREYRKEERRHEKEERKREHHDRGEHGNGRE